MSTIFGRLSLAIVIGSIAAIRFDSFTWGYTSALVTIALQFARDVFEIKSAIPYVDLDGEIQQEVRPTLDVIGHVILFRWLFPILGDGDFFQRILVRLNADCLTWDSSFTERGENGVEWITNFCKRWKIQIDPWIWEKRLKDYETPNDFFARRYSKKSMPSLGNGIIVSPATAVMTWFNRTSEMPKKLKNEDWNVDESIGIPNVHMYKDNSCAIFYLSPTDYHCFHIPIEGIIEHVELLNQDRFSVTVKPYIFRNVNILKRNRRAVIVIRGSHVRVAMIIIGGITVDSIRLDSKIRKGSSVSKGQFAGNFARGGSSVALLFDTSFTKNQQRRHVVQAPCISKFKGNVVGDLDFKVSVRQNVGDVVVESSSSSS